jgi:hypothetical protein
VGHDVRNEEGLGLLKKSTIIIQTLKFRTAVDSYPVFMKFVQYVTMSCANLTSSVSYISGLMSGKPNDSSISSPCFTPVYFGQGLRDDWWL